MHRVAAFLTSLLLVTALHAAPASEDSIDALLTATRAEALVESMYVNMEQLMRQSMAAATQGQTVTPEQQRILDAVPSKFARVMREELSWAKMRPLYVQIYRQSFSEDEIEGLLAFYRSPAGQAFVAKMPEVMQRSMTMMQSQLGPLMEKMKAAMQEAITEADLPR